MSEGVIAGQGKFRSSAGQDVGMQTLVVGNKQRCAKGAPERTNQDDADVQAGRRMGDERWIRRAGKAGKAGCMKRGKGQWEEGKKGRREGCCGKCEVTGEGPGVQ
jgi:hypothetical protein